MKFTISQHRNESEMQCTVYFKKKACCSEIWNDPCRVVAEIPRARGATSARKASTAIQNSVAASHALAPKQIRDFRTPVWSVLILSPYAFVNLVCTFNILQQYFPMNESATMNPWIPRRKHSISKKYNDQNLNSILKNNLLNTLLIDYFPKKEKHMSNLMCWYWCHTRLSINPRYVNDGSILTHPNF